MYTRIDWYWTPTSGMQRISVAPSTCCYAAPAPRGCSMMVLAWITFVLRESATYWRAMVERLTGSR
jgi:hypothetical protein